MYFDFARRCPTLRWHLRPLSVFYRLFTLFHLLIYPAVLRLIGRIVTQKKKADIL